ncbi:MAG: Fe-S cluster assembly protein SufD [Rikenellaceae bacterium]
MNNFSPFDNYRQSAQKFFDDKGMPSSKVEYYKYSSVANFIGNEEVFYNDTREIGKLSEKENGIITGSLILFADRYKEIFEKYYNIIASKEQDSMVALNTALASGGEVVFIPKNVHLDAPILIDLSQEANDFGRRDLFILGENANANIVIHHGKTPNILNRVCEIILLDGANLEVVEDNSDNKNSRKINTTLVSQHRNSTFKHTAVVAQQGFCRNNIKVSMTEEGSSCHLNGVAISREEAHIDNTTTVEHLAERCTSYQLYKNVAADKATAVFGGNIFVAPGAQKTEAYQKNNNILLSDDATIHTKPQLVINADDVKCSHGATVGQLNEEALFYIRQRGISETQAQGLLLTGFIGEVLQKIDEEDLREELTEKLQSLCSI